MRIKIPHHAFSLALFGLLGSHLPAFAAEDCQLNGHEVRDSYGADFVGKSGIMRCKDRDTGKLSREREYKNGKQIGLVRDYTDGVLRREYSIDEASRRHGAEREFAANKQLLLEEMSVHGEMSGIKRQWYENGQLMLAEAFANGKSTGGKIRYTAKGKLSELSCAEKPVLAPHVDDASLCGFKGKPSNLDYFHDDGTAYARETYLAGVTQKYAKFGADGKPRSSYELQGKQGIEIDYFDNGNKKQEILWAENEKPRQALRRARFDANGSLLEEKRYEMREDQGKRYPMLVLEARYFMNGQPKARESYRNEGKDVIKTVEWFHDNGKLAMQENLLLVDRYTQRNIGVRKNFAENGNLSMENHFDAQGKLQRERKFDASGKLISDEEVFADGSRKAFAK